MPLLLQRQYRFIFLPLSPAKLPCRKHGSPLHFFSGPFFGAGNDRFLESTTCWKKKGDRILFSASSYPHPLSFFLCPGSSHTSFPSDSPTPIPFRPGKKSHRRSSNRRKKTRVEKEAQILAFPPPPPPPYPVSIFFRAFATSMFAHICTTTTQRVGGKEGVREEGKEGRILTSERKQRTSPPSSPLFDRGNFPCRQLLFPISPFVKTAVNDGGEQTRRSQTD